MTGLGAIEVSLSLHTAAPSKDAPDVGKVADWGTVHFREESPGRWVNTDDISGHIVVPGGVVTFRAVAEEE